MVGGREKIVFIFLWIKNNTPPPFPPLPFSHLVQVVGRQRPVQRLDDAPHRPRHPLHLGLGVEARDNRVEPRRELQVVERLPFLADGVLGVDFGALDVALFDGFFDLGKERGGDRWAS